MGICQGLWCARWPILLFTYLNEKGKKNMFKPLADALEVDMMLPLDVAVPGELESLFASIRKGNGGLSISSSTPLPFRRRTRCAAVWWTFRARGFLHDNGRVVLELHPYGSSRRAADAERADRFLR